MIPNVSAIYRDLACMADPQGYKPSQSVPELSQSIDHSQKQHRHNELMNKLRNAQQDSNTLNSELNQFNNYPSYSHKPVSSPYQNTLQESPLNIDVPSFNRFEATTTPTRSWKPPNIRYRHIEDVQRPNLVSAPPPMFYKKSQKTPLQREFYEQEAPKSKQAVKGDAVTSPPIVQEEKSEVERQSEMSYGRTWLNRESKFEQKLQSYYQLCKKRPISSKVEGREVAKPSRNKFERSSNRVPVMQLQKAIKMLSID